MLKTERCQLTTPTPEDRDSFQELNLNPAVRRFLGGVIQPTILDEKFSKVLSPAPGTFNFAVRLPECNFVGLVTLSPHHEGHDTELSYQFLPKFWGRGLAFEATKAVLNYALDDLKLPQIVSETQAANQASRKLLERLGMKPLKTVTRFGEQQVIYSTETN